jgi:hypothetical protein
VDRSCHPAADEDTAMPETTFHATTQKRWTAFLRTFNAPNDPCVEPRDAAALEPQITFEDAAARMLLLKVLAHGSDDDDNAAFTILELLGIVPQQRIKTRMCIASCFGLQWVSLREARARSTGRRVQFDLGPEWIGDYAWVGAHVIAAHIMTLAYARQLRQRTPEETAYALSRHGWIRPHADQFYMSPGSSSNDPNFIRLDIRREAFVDVFWPGWRERILGIAGTFESAGHLHIAEPLWDAIVAWIAYEECPFLERRAHRPMPGPTTPTTTSVYLGKYLS